MRSVQEAREETKREAGVQAMTAIGAAAIMYASDEYALAVHVKACQNIRVEKDGGRHPRILYCGKGWLCADAEAIQRNREARPVQHRPVRRQRSPAADDGYVSQHQ